MLFYPPPTVSPVQAQCSRQRSPAHSVSKAGRRASSASAAPCSWSAPGDRLTAVPAGLYFSFLSVPTRSNSLQGSPEGREATQHTGVRGRELLAKRLWETHRDVTRPSALQATPRHPQWSGWSRNQPSDAVSRPGALTNAIWLYISRRTPPAKAAEMRAVQQFAQQLRLARPALTLRRLEVIALGRADRAGGASLGNQGSHQQQSCLLHWTVLGRSLQPTSICRPIEHMMLRWFWISHLLF